MVSNRSQMFDRMKKLLHGLLAPVDDANRSKDIDLFFKVLAITLILLVSGGLIYDLLR